MSGLTILIYGTLTTVIIGVVYTTNRQVYAPRSVTGSLQVTLELEDVVASVTLGGGFGMRTFQREFHTSMISSWGGGKDRAPPKEDISDRYHVPEELVGEVLTSAIRHRRQESNKQLFAVDLFAGTAGAAGVVTGMGICYVHVDISTDLFPEQFPPAVTG